MKMNIKKVIFVICLLVFSMLAADFLLFNVHISPLYVRQQARLYPANITISPTCSWSKPGSFTFEDYKPKSFVLIARMLSIAYKRYGIIPILRGGSFLHTYRRIKADTDMDIYIIVPKNITMSDAYAKIRHIIRSDTEFKDIMLETQNALLSGIFYDKSDAIRISVNGTKLVDVNVLHETFINDPGLQAPCLKQMHCKHLHDTNDAYIEANSHHIITKNLFQSLCECDYMDSTLLCFDRNGAKFLEIKYGKNFTVRRNSKDMYKLIYERPHKTWRKAISSFPAIMNLKTVFEGHVNEHNVFLSEIPSSTTEAFAAVPNQTHSSHVSETV